MIQLSILIVLLLLVGLKADVEDDIPPCIGVDYIEANYVSSSIYGSYTLSIHQDLSAGTEIRIRFLSNVTVSVDSAQGNLTELGNNEYKISILKPTNTFTAAVRRGSGSRPYSEALASVKINDTEHCKRPIFGFTLGLTPNQKPKQKSDESLCGKRKVNHNQLIVYGQQSKPGDWPWHVALNTVYQSTFKYICGGTLISESFVLTAAHCVTRNGIAILPESIGVSLGKQNLIGGDPDPQERGVFKITVHEDFAHKTLDNDIALLKLSTKAVYNDYIQPACLWFDEDKENIPSGDIVGVVAGWGFDQSGSLSTDLRFANMPLVPDTTCIRKNPLFYAQFLNGKRFCAGVVNGTSACNGDSGGGFVVFTPDTTDTETNSSQDGIWYVRGIVSIAFSRRDGARTLCDPYEYVLFTDINEYKDWISDNIK